MKKKTVKIIFIRHGESEKNVLNMSSHSLDMHPLTEKGRKEVRKIVEKFSDKIDIILVSPVLRARETAEILNKKIGAEIKLENAILEYNYGEWNDIPKRELLKSNKNYQKYKKLTSLEDKFNFRLGKNGESRKEIVERIGKFIKKLVKNNLEKTILIVSHGGINAAICKAVSNCSMDEYFAQEKIGHNVIQYFVVDENCKIVDYKSRKY